MYMHADANAAWLRALLQLLVEATLANALDAWPEAGSDVRAQKHRYSTSLASLQ